MGIRRLAAIVLATGLVLPVVASAAFVTSLQFQQITVEPTDIESEPESPGRYGMVVVGFDKDPETSFLNMVAEIPGPGATTAWIVRNMPLVDMTWGPPFEEIGYRFPLDQLGVVPGETVTEIHYGYILTPEPMSDDEAAMWMPTQPLDGFSPVLMTTIMIGGGILDWIDSEPAPDPPANPYPIFGPFGLWEIWSWIGCQMDNVDLDSTDDKNGCVPAGAANSLDWLRDQHDDIDFPGTTKDAFKQLGNLMNRLAGDGVSAKEMARAKLDFIEAHKLPIHVKIQDHFSSGAVGSSSGRSFAADTDSGRTWPNVDWLFSESLKGEDVELMYGYWYKKNGEWFRDFGHMVTLTGAAKVCGIPFITFKSDSSQTSAGGAAHEIGWIEIDDDGAMILPGHGGRWKHYGDPVEYEHTAKIDGVVSESRDTTVTYPDETVFDMTKYCQYHTITVAPGDTLTMVFPDSSHVRNFNIETYEVERMLNPPKPRLTGIFTNNGGQTRTYVNTSSLCTTIKIHNDEYHHGGAQPGPYQPWPLRVSTKPRARTAAKSNPFPVGGGFSLGGDDDSAWEFGDIVQPVHFFTGGVGVSLGDLPAHLGVSGGTQDLWIHWPVDDWNPWWEQLGFVLDVAEVLQPGNLMVEFPETGDVFDIAITAPGAYERTLMPTMPGPEFRVHLVPQNGLEMTLDSVGVPTLLAVVAGAPDRGEVPEKPVVLGIHPNPFNPSTTISFGIPESGPVELGVYDLQGHLVASVFSGDLGVGYHEMTWDGRTVGGRPAAAGIYVARLVSGDETVTKKMTLVK